MRILAIRSCLNGLVDHPIENVSMSNITVEYRGGLNMEHATEQRQLNRTVSITPYQSAPSTQSLPWLANTFFSRNEGLLPRVSWDARRTAGKERGATIPTIFRR